MTYEWSIIISIIVLCGTYVYSTHTPTDSLTEDALEWLRLANAKLAERIESLEDNYALISKTAEETKKLLSQENLARGVRGLR